MFVGYHVNSTTFGHENLHNQNLHNTPTTPLPDLLNRHDQGRGLPHYHWLVLCVVL